MIKNIDSDVDWKKITFIAAPILLVGGVALGMFVAKPMWDKAKAKKLADKKKPSDAKAKA